MNRSLALLCIGLLFGGGIGFAIAAGNGITLDGHDHADPGQHAAHAGMTGGEDGAMAGHHDHSELLVVSEDAPAPTLDATVTRDPVSGWNVHLVTGNFRFAPEHASKAHVPGEGHAHLYVNGEKIARLYGPWAHVASLPDGKTTIRVTLNSNDHRALAVGSEPVETTIEIDTAAPTG